MPCSYFKAVWGFILIAGPAPTVIQLLLGAFVAAASLPLVDPVLSHQRLRVAWGHEGDRMGCKAAPSHVWPLCLRTSGLQWPRGQLHTGPGERETWRWVSPLQLRKGH